MCGRYSLSIDSNELPGKFVGTVFGTTSANDTTTTTNDSNDSNDSSQTMNVTNVTNQTNDSNDNEISDDIIYTANSTDSNTYSIILRHNLKGRFKSYNIAPTSNSVIIYKESAHKFIFETSSFGIVPFWAKPEEKSPDKQTKELRASQSKHFNCRRETLIQGSSLWNSVKKQRCIVPIEGYFEWQKKGNDKIPYFVHSKKYGLIFLAGFYSHNSEFKMCYQPNSGYFSSFTIITGPAEKNDDLDLSWLHGRKPLMLEPGTKQWDDWLDPNIETSGKLINECLESNKSKAYSTIVSYTVSKDVGKVSSQGEYLIKEVKKERGIESFFKRRPESNESSPKRKDPESNESSPKRIKKE